VQYGACAIKAPVEMNKETGYKPLFVATGADWQGKPSFHRQIGATDE